ncbi:LOW QUALITY PROTEIN: S-canadine synthase-like protein [Cinnamomum micranthum f. kanehirae]|uniref:S-canadine synthase-like protein n=1 Tax=Cinnamomum micranthum f. kanehirae TaxID=337451 RepID=A0A3S3N878_9MAGN|nr:LOW QUALITY PROTEIN: S-canadine synthase-like protein [Cinnamomum micranthum f. kanehirae]
MEAIWTAVAIGIAAAVLIAFRERQRQRLSRKPTQWPPGPTRLPLIGNMHQILKGGDPFHVVINKLAQVYGPLMTVWFGTRQPTIIVSGHDLVWEVLVSKSADYAAREIPSIFKSSTTTYSTISTSDASPHWHSLRRGFQNGAIGPLSLSVQAPFQESDMAQMINNMIKEANLNGGVVKPFQHIRRATIKLLARLCFGSDFNDEDFEANMDFMVDEALRCNDEARILDTFPPARFLPSVKRTIMKMEKLQLRVEEYIGRHLASPPPPNCYAHFLLSQNFPIGVTISSIFEVFILGLDSTGSTTMWALGLLVHNQEAQQKLYQEIRDHATCTEKGIVKVEEVGKLEYLQAVVKETMRMKPIAPLAVPHRAARDTTLDGLHVAEGTTTKCGMNRSGSSRSESSKEFLGKRGQYSFLPFGAGMRACAGMEVGNLQLLFAVSNLGEEPNLSEDFSFILAMKTPLEARIVPRGI